MQQGRHRRGFLADPGSSDPEQGVQARVFALRLLGMIMSGLAMFSLTALGWLFFWAAAPQLIGWKTMAITSGSMQPRIGIGDAVIVEPGVSSLAPGRLVTFNDPVRPGQMITHRLVTYNNDGTWTTKGDANANNDSTPVPTSSIVGTAKAVIPYVGFPTVWRQNGNMAPLGLLVAVVVASAVALPISNRIEAHVAGPQQPSEDDDPAQNLGLALPAPATVYPQQPYLAANPAIPRQNAWGQHREKLQHTASAAPTRTAQASTWDEPAQRPTWGYRPGQR